jgi:DNA-binding HxlR family transcriptional regulator
MLRRDYSGQHCSIARTLELLGERWTLLVIRDILEGRRRFDQIQSSLGVARNVLASRLARLVEEGILEKRPYGTHPRRHEYFLTEKGLDLWPVLIAMLDWGDRHLADGGPPTLITHKHCGGRVDGRGYCERCGKRLSARDAAADRTEHARAAA